MHIFLRDGAMYFFIIFLANFVNTVIYYVSVFRFFLVLIFILPTRKTAVEDLKAIGATFSQLITATMISRLVLNLRSISDTRSNTGPSTILPFQAASRKKLDDTFMTRTIVGNLGQDIMTGFDSTIDEGSRDYELQDTRRFSR